MQKPIGQYLDDILDDIDEENKPSMPFGISPIHNFFNPFNNESVISEIVDSRKREIENGNNWFNQQTEEYILSTDPTHLTTDCIGLTSHGQQRTRKRRATECGLSNNYNNNILIAPKRKKRKLDHTEEDIRRQYNRKSIQDSRERRKQQEHFLNERLPKCLALKRLLISDNISTSSVKTEESELNEMKMILEKMVDNNGNEYEYANNKSIISDELIFNVLSEYLSPTNNEEDEDDVELETDHNEIHLQVIGEIENGIPMQVDDIPISATPMSFKESRGRKKKKKNEKEVKVFAAPPMMPQIISDMRIPPTVFGTETNDFNITKDIPFIFRQNKHH